MWEKSRPQPHFCFFFLLIPTNWEPGTGFLKTTGLMDLKVNTQFCSKHYTMPQLSPTHLIKLGECTWPNNSTAATLTGILELTRNELSCQRTKWDTVHEWPSSLKDYPQMRIIGNFWGEKRILYLTYHQWHEIHHFYYFNTNYNNHDKVCFLFNNTDSLIINMLTANFVFQAFERWKKLNNT